MSDGLPVFCGRPHYVPSLKAFSLPLWELPLETSWIRPALETCRSGTDADGVTEEDLRGDEQETSSYSVIESADEADQACELAMRDLHIVDGREWSLESADRIPTLFRRVPSASAAAGYYRLGMSLSLFPGRLRQTSEAVLDHCLLRWLSSRQPQIAVLALHGSGHFAGAIFRGPEALLHKTLHRYTCRAKQGGSQAAFDAKGAHAKSAGSGLRRHCHRRLLEEVRELLTGSWAAEVAASDLILISVSSKMRSSLLGTRELPHIPHEKVASLRFAVARPTFQAVREAYVRATRVLFCEELALGRLPAPSQTPRASDAPPPSPLHAAAAAGDEDEIAKLLNAGADPTAKDERGRVPFEVCLSRAARRAFCAYSREQAGAWDWAAAGVPLPRARRQRDDGLAAASTRISRARRSKTGRQTEVALSSPTGGPSNDDGQSASSTARQPPNRAEGRADGRPRFQNTSQSRRFRKDLASGIAMAHSDYRPRPSRCFPSAHRLAN